MDPVGRTTVLASLGVALCTALVSCNIALVDITITVGLTADMNTPAGQSISGTVQGYVYTPTDTGGSDGAPGPPGVFPSPIPPAGYGIPTTSVLVSLQSGGTTKRPDANGFFMFPGFAVDLTPVQVRVEFPSGAYTDVVTGVPITPVDFQGFAWIQVDLQDNEQYRNNARDIRSLSSVTINMGLSSSQGGLARVFVSGRGDLTRDTVQTDESAFLIFESTLQAGQTRRLQDVRPLNEARLLTLATPSLGNEMFFVYLVAEEPLHPENGVAVSLTGCEMHFNARVSAPL